MKSCTVCREFKSAVCSDCFEQRELSRKLDREWEEQAALSQKEIEQKQKAEPKP